MGPVAGFLDVVGNALAVFLDPGLTEDCSKPVTDLVSRSKPLGGPDTADVLLPPCTLARMSCVVDDNCGKTGVVGRTEEQRPGVSAKTFNRRLFVLVDAGPCPAELSRDALCE